MKKLLILLLFLSGCVSSPDVNVINPTIPPTTSEPIQYEDVVTLKELTIEEMNGRWVIRYSFYEEISKPFEVALTWKHSFGISDEIIMVYEKEGKVETSHVAGVLETPQWVKIVPIKVWINQQ